VSKKTQAQTEFEDKMNARALAFNKKLAEFQEWGFSEGIMIEAFIKGDHTGIFPYISWVEMTPEQIKMRDDYNAKMVAEAAKEDLANKKSQDATA